MSTPELHNDGEDKDWYFLVQPAYTTKLIEFLRKNLDGFSVDIGGLTVDYAKDEDVFSVPEDVTREVLQGLLKDFFRKL